MKMKQLTVAMITLLLTASCSEKQQDYPFRNPDLPLEERIDDLLSRLTPEEKIGQMMNVTPAIERLGIPTYDWWNEALHGVARAGRATVFPQAIAMAATFDDNAVHETFTMVSDEARAKYHQYQKDKEYDRYKGLTFWTPNINIFRDPRWGRGMETYGEDPYLTEKMGVAVTRGLQGDDPNYYKTHACAKHYAVHSGPEWNRHEFNAEATPRDLYETYLPAFEALVKEGDVQEVMCAYNRFEGKPCCSSDKLLIDILRNSWGYDNIILSDCGAIDDFWRKDKNTPRHETHPDAESASADAVLNGTDLECGGSYRALNKALADGKISEKDLDVSLRRLLKGRFELGMFDPDERVPYSKIPYSVVESPEHIAKALDMARKSIVLLKNKNNMLPLDKNIKKIAVVGPNAADSTMLWANYNGFPSKTVTIVEGIRNKVPNAEVIYELGCNHTADFVVTDLGSHVSSTAGQGFASEFFNNTEFEGTPAYKGLAKELHYTTGGNTQFAPNVNLTNFTARFTGEFESPIDGPVEFKLSGNDAFRLYIDTAKVAEVWENEYGAEKLYTLNAKKGEKYPIKIEYMQRTGSADLNFTVGVRTPVDFQATASKVKDADVIVFVGGISPRLEGEEMPVDAEGFRKGDRTNIEIPAVQKEMVKALVATGKPVVYVVCTGSALALNWENDHVNAILNAWYGGQEGGTAVADVLFGDYNPAGRLPITFYKSVDQLPDFQDYSMKGRTYRYMTQTPLYPFGYGLSYTTFDYKNAKLSKDKIASNESVTLSFDIANTGKMDGDEVAQIYIKNPNDPAGPLKAMKATARFTGEFESPIDGPVEFKLSGNDAFRLYIDTAKVAEVWENEYGAEKLYTLNAKKGEKYPIKIEYMQRTGSADLNFTVGVRTPVDFQATASKVKDADVIVFVGGISPRLEGEEMPVDAEGFRKGDRTNIEIPAVQKEMVKALVATGKPVVYVVCTGSALALNWENDHVNAILNAWYGGQEGGTAVADVLFGDYNPAGRLPITFYKSVDQLPDFQDYSMKGRTYRYMTQTPLYPFGYGLSYTTFDYKNAKLSKDKIASNESVTLSFDIANTGKMDGDEVAQIYIKNPNDPAGPLKAMKAFKRVNVKAGSEQPVSIQLEPKAFQSFNDNTQTMEVRPGKYQILYGGSSDDKTLKNIDLVIE